MSLTTPCSVQKLQTALHAKAKESPNFRFYAVYDKVYRRDVLAYATNAAKLNGGAAGVEEQTFGDIEHYGVETMAGRSGARAEKSKLSTATCTAGLHTQAGCGTETVKHTHNPRSGCTNGSRLVLEPTGMLVKPESCPFCCGP